MIHILNQKHRVLMTHLHGLPPIPKEESEIHTWLQRVTPHLLRLPAICFQPGQPLILTGTAMPQSSQLVNVCL